MAEGGGQNLSFMDYWKAVYGVPLGNATIDVSMINFFWDSVPARDNIAVHFSCYSCPLRKQWPLGMLWAPQEETSLSPFLCRAGHPCDDTELIGRFNPESLRFPGFWVQRYNHQKPDSHFVQGIPDNMYAEVLRIARIDDGIVPSDTSNEGQVQYTKLNPTSQWFTSSKLNRTGLVLAGIRVRDLA